MGLVGRLQSLLNSNKFFFTCFLEGVHCIDWHLKNVRNKRIIFYKNIIYTYRIILHFKINLALNRIIFSTSDSHFTSEIMILKNCSYSCLPKKKIEKKRLRRNSFEVFDTKSFLNSIFNYYSKILHFFWIF